MLKDDEGTRDVTLSSFEEKRTDEGTRVSTKFPILSVDETRLIQGYESSPEYSGKENIRVKRIKKRFESIDVAAIMGKSKKNRNVLKRIDKDGTKDDAKIQDETGILDDSVVGR